MARNRTTNVTVRLSKNIVLAYVLWFFFGHFGIHRIYLGRVGSGIAQLVLGIVGWATVWFLFGFVFLIPLWIWLFVDLFLIPGMCSSPKEATLFTFTTTYSDDQDEKQ